MIYFMDTYTLVKEYTKDHTSKEVLDTLFVPVSSRIRIPEKEPNVIGTDLYAEKLIFALTGSKEDKEVVSRGVFEDPSKTALVMNIITRALVEKRRVVLLCSPNEMKTHYIEVLAKVIEEKFDYPVINYKKNKNKDYIYDPVKVAKKIKQVENYVITNLLEEERYRKKSLDLMSKEEMKKKLKELKLYSKGMSKSEMKDMLQVFFVER